MRFTCNKGGFNSTIEEVEGGKKTTIGGCETKGGIRGKLDKDCFPLTTKEVSGGTK